MITLVIGTPDSGKSEWAENIVTKLKKSEKAAYIATMIPFDDEGTARIEKHRKKRQGKGFITYEKSTSVDELIPVLKKDKINICLLECISNLVGNEIYLEENSDINDEDLINMIESEVINLGKGLDHLVIVANLFEFEDSFDDETKRYVQIQNEVTEGLKSKVDRYYIKQGEKFILYENN